MQVKQNIGIINALVRITCGLTILAWSTAKMVKNPWRDSYLVMALLAAMKVGEGIVRYCPVTAVFKEQMREDKSKDDDQVQDQLTPYNPT